MKYLFDVVCYLSSTGGYFVQIPDLKGCATEGESYDDAIENMHEAAHAYLVSLTEDGIPIPEHMLGNKPPEGARMVTIEVEDADGIGGDTVTATEAAQMLGISRSRVSHLLRDGILKGKRVGREMHVTLDSIEERRASDHPAGRPPGHGSRRA